MKLINWRSLKFGLKKMLNISDRNDYLSKRIDNFEKLAKTGDSLPFKIKDIREKGFIVNIAGLHGYISFYHMPWKYDNIDAWRTIYPFITGKILFGKIHLFRKKPLLIILDGEIPQFKKPELKENRKYKGIIINKTNFGVFVDIGYNFGWKCGSLVGLLHKLNFEPAELFDKIEPGEIIEVLYWGYNKKKQLVFGNRTELKEWFIGEIEELVGKVLPVNVIKPDGDKIYYLVENKFNATLPTTEYIYQENRQQIRHAVSNLKNGDIIHCKITHIDYSTKTLQLKWKLVSEIEKIISRNPHHGKTFAGKISYDKILNRVSNGVVEKLNLLEKTVKVEVVKNKNNNGKCQNKYIIEDKFHGKLIVSNTAYRISDKEKEQIEQNLQDGEILNCTVLSVDKNLIRIKWTLSDEELFRFLK